MCASTPVDEGTRDATLPAREPAGVSGVKPDYPLVPTATSNADAPPTTGKPTDDSPSASVTSRFPGGCSV